MDVNGMFRLFIVLFGIYLVIATTDTYDSSEDSSEDFSEEDSEDYQVSKEECLNAAHFTHVRTTCCFSIELVDETVKDCIEPRRRYLNSDDEKLRCRQISLVAECVYKKRNFITSTNRLNMSAVKDYVESYYPKQPETQSFMIDMYRVCKRQASEKLRSYSREPKGRDILKGTHRPYFMFILTCVINYPNINCPYYTWMGLGSEQTLCDGYASTCNERYFENTSTYD